jgi:GDP-L-fucose synthase
MSTETKVSFPLAGKRVWVAGHRGMVGSAIVRRLASVGAKSLTVDRAEVDLRSQPGVEAWMERERPEVVVVAAAKVGGILANSQAPAEFLYDNIAIATNIIHGAHKTGVEKLLFLGSTCVYPKFAPQPMPEDSLLTGPLEPTNEWYAVAKIAGIKLCQAYRRQYGSDFISAMPSNIYGPGDNFDPTASHVLPSLLRKISEAKRQSLPTVEIWGSGTPRREFIHVDDVASGLVHLLENYSGESHVNIGMGHDISIKDLAEEIAAVVGYKGTFTFDRSKPDGTPRKLVDTSLITSLGWAPKIELRQGLESTYAWMTGEEELRGVA